MPARSIRPPHAPRWPLTFGRTNKTISHARSIIHAITVEAIQVCACSHFDPNQRPHEQSNAAVCLARRASKFDTGRAVPISRRRVLYQRIARRAISCKNLTPSSPTLSMFVKDFTELVGVALRVASALQKSRSKRSHCLIQKRTPNGILMHSYTVSRSCDGVTTPELDILYP